MSIVASIDALVQFIDIKDTEEKTNEPDECKREVLPSNIRPQHYFLSLFNIDLEKDFTYNGNVLIDLNIKENNTSKIMINSGDIKYKSITITQNNETQTINPDTISENKQSQQVTIPLTKSLIKGSAKLEISFIGSIQNTLNGFYRSKYQLSSGIEAYCATTQFEACSARLAFPCWDEPAAKATFQIQIDYPKELICISNMPSIKNEIIKGDIKRILFDTTPKMSTYLLAWCIGDFEYIESKTARGINMKIYTTYGNKNRAKYALNIATKCLDFYEKYFEINYPLPKCDMIALKDFAGGAMENWGLVTYRANLLLCDPATVALRRKQYIAEVICHELAHMWFGNLVTPDWWNQLWLKEGFASFMQYFSADIVDPSLNIWSLYILQEYSSAFRLDGMKSSHPIEVDVYTAKGADEVFDAISYCKGACIITMLQSYLGDDVFRKALNKYLNHFAYSVAVTNDLWQFLSKESGKNVGDIMNNWTRKQGFPLIDAIITDKKNGKILLKQSRFLLSSMSDDEKKDMDETIWNVPIVMKIDGKLIPILLTKSEEEFTVKEIINAKYVHLNADSKGFYCTHYSKVMLNYLVKHLDYLSDIDRICLIRDLKALSKSGNEYANDATQQLMNLLLASKSERSNIVWDELLTVATEIYEIMNQETKIKFDTIMRDLLFPIYLYLNGWGDDDSAEQKQNIERKDVFRPLIISALAKYGNKEILKVINDKFNKFIIDKNDIEIPDALRYTIYSYALKYGDIKEYNGLKEYYLNTKDDMDKRRALQCLGCTKNKQVLVEILNWAKNSDDVRKQDKIFALRTVARSEFGKDIFWEFLQKSVNEWKEIYGTGGWLLNDTIKLPSKFSSNDKANEVENFYNQLKGFDACKKAINQCVETIRLNAGWKNRQIKNVQDWVNKNYSD